MLEREPPLYVGSPGMPCPPPGDLSGPGMEPGSPALQADSYRLSHQGRMGLAPKFIRLFRKMLWQNPKELLGQPNTVFVSDQLQQWPPCLGPRHLE